MRRSWSVVALRGRRKKGADRDFEPESSEKQGGLRCNLLAAVLSTLTGMLPVYLVGTLEVEITRSLRFGPSALGEAVSLSFAASALSAVPFSRVTERVGGVRVMQVGSALQALILVLMAATARSWDMLVVFLVLAGLPSGALPPATYAFLSRRTRTGREGLAYGINQAAVPLAPLLAGFAVPLIALTIGWRFAIGLGAVFAAGASIAATRSGARIRLAGKAREPRDRSALSLLPLGLLAAGFFCGMFATNAVLAFLAAGAVAVGFGKGMAGLVVALGSATAVAVRVFTGHRADRRGERHFPAVAAMLCVGGAGYALLAMSAVLRLTWLLVPAAMLGLGAGWGWNGLLIFAVVRAHLHAPARATGIVDVGGRMGGVLGPLAAGLLIAEVSYTSVWVMAAIASFTGAGVILLGGKMLGARIRDP